EPFYENYGPDCVISGAVPRYVALRPPDWAFDPDELRRAFNSRTRAIVVNTPHNPTGKVYSQAELELIAQLCREHDAIAITDEIYERLVYRSRHISIATLPGMADRMITISGSRKLRSPPYLRPASIMTRPWDGATSGSAFRKGWRRSSAAWPRCARCALNNQGFDHHVAPPSVASCAS